MNADTKPVRPTDVFSATRVGTEWRFSGNSAAHFGHSMPSATQAMDDGVFLRWKHAAGVATVENDRYGLYPSYCARFGGRHSISPSLRGLMGSRASWALDYEALSVFLRLGQFVGDDTPVEGIKVLSPGSKVEFDRSGVRYSRRGTQGTFDRRVSKESAADRFGELFSDSMRRRLEIAGRFAVPLSGGRDSRHIVLEAARVGQLPELCLTVDEWPEDSRVGGCVAHRLGIPHQLVSAPGDAIGAEIKLMHRSQFSLWEGGWMTSLCAELESSPANAVFDGIAGDMLSNALFLSDSALTNFRNWSAEAIADSLVPEDDYRLDKYVANDLLAELSRERAVARVAAEVCLHLKSGNPVTSFFFWNRTRRRIGAVPYGMLLGVSPVVFAPYLDHAVFDFLTSLSPEVLLPGQFHDLTIARRFPNWASIGYEAKGVADHDRTEALAQSVRKHAWALLRRRRSRLLAFDQVVPRLALYICSGKRAARGASYLRRVLYLAELEKAISDGAE
jgi:hypothetical protein